MSSGTLVDGGVDTLATGGTVGFEPGFCGGCRGGRALGFVTLAELSGVMTLALGATTIVAGAALTLAAAPTTGGALAAAATLGDAG